MAPRRRSRSSVVVLAVVVAIIGGAIGVWLARPGADLGLGSLPGDEPSAVEGDDGTGGPGGDGVRLEAGGPEPDGEAGIGGTPVPAREGEVDNGAGVESGDGEGEGGVPGSPRVRDVLATDVGCPNPVAGDPVVIGLATASTDGSGIGLQPVGLEVVAARHLAGLVNCSGGVDGRPVEVVAGSVGDSALTARDAVFELLAADPVAVLGPGDLAAGIRVVEAVDGRVPVLVPLGAASAFADPGRGSFLVGPDVSALAATAARYAIEEGWRSAVTFSNVDPVSALAGASFAGWFERGGGVVAADLPVVPDEGGVVDLGDEVDRLGVGPTPRRPPDVLFAGVGGSALVALSEALARAEVEVPLLAIDDRGPGGEVWSSLDGVTVFGRDGASTVGVSQFDRSVRDAGGDAFADPVAAARVADAVLVVLEAVARSGGTDAQAVADELAGGWTIEGIAGPVGVWPGESAWTTFEVPVAVLEGGRPTSVDGLSPLPDG